MPASVTHAGQAVSDSAARQTLDLAALPALERVATGAVDRAAPEALDHPTQQAPVRVAPHALDRAALQALDRADTLASFRDEFDLPADVIYLDGNSLGPLPKATCGRVAEVVAGEWGQSLIRGWNMHGWMQLPLRVGEKLGRIIGAEPGSTLVADFDLGQSVQAAGGGAGGTSHPPGHLDGDW